MMLPLLVEARRLRLSCASLFLAPTGATVEGEELTAVVADSHLLRSHPVKARDKIPERKKDVQLIPLAAGSSMATLWEPRSSPCAPPEAINQREGTSAVQPRTHALFHRQS